MLRLADCVAVEEAEAADPSRVSLLGGVAVVSEAARRPDLVEELGGGGYVSRRGKTDREVRRG